MFAKFNMATSAMATAQNNLLNFQDWVNVNISGIALWWIHGQKFESNIQLLVYVEPRFGSSTSHVTYALMENPYV